MNQLNASDNQYFLDILNLIVADQKDILAANYLRPLSTHYIPWSGYSVRPSALVKILNDIWMNRRSLIVECGGGISTFYIARLLKDRGGHLYAIDNNKKWLDLLQEQLQKEAIDHLVTFIHAPLKPSDLALGNTPWYDTDRLSQELSQDKKIDLLLVDGPPAYSDELKYSRYPAVPYFLSRLAPDFTIILDDANRAGEQEIVKRWEKILNLNFEMADGNVAIATCRGSGLQL